MLTTLTLAAALLAPIGPVPGGAPASQGLTQTCPIADNRVNCYSYDDTMAGSGFNVEINYNGLQSHTGTGTGSLYEWIHRSGQEGLRQAINVKNAIEDGLSGHSLVDFAEYYAKECGATTNQQVIDCIIHSGVTKDPGFWVWYLYDEPGCPDQMIGYCQGSIAGKNYANLHAVAQYIQQNDGGPILGYQTVSGTPPLGWQSGDVAGGAVRQINDLFSCNGHVECNGIYPWITDPAVPNTGFAWYPFGYPPGNQKVTDLQYIVPLVQSTINANQPGMTRAVAVQAFSYYQYPTNGCTDISLCPYPTRAQMKQELGLFLYWGYMTGNPVSTVIYYGWSDIWCHTGHTYPGCNGQNNYNQVVWVAFTPTVSPPNLPMTTQPPHAMPTLKPRPPHW